MAWDDAIKEIFEQIANDLRCRLRHTEGGCIFTYKNKDFYFSYFQNTIRPPIGSVKIVYSKEVNPSKNKVGKLVEIGNYAYEKSELDKMKIEIIVKIVEGVSNK